MSFVADTMRENKEEIEIGLARDVATSPRGNDGQFRENALARVC